MAENKKSFIAYCDWLELFENLTNEEAGKLVKHLFNYVNDKNPKSDKITELLFIQIKQSLKRDLKKYEKFIDKQRVNGALGGRPKNNPPEPKKPKPLFNNPPEPKKPDSDSDSDSDSETINIYFDEETFLEWFIKCRQHIGLLANFKKLTYNERLLFSNLKNTYTKDDFKKAFNGFSKDSFFKENKMLFPIHFLKEENFTKFLNYKELTLAEKLAGKC